MEALPTNVDLWTQAAFLEEEDARKRRVLRKALERVPTSVRLWKAVVDLSPEEDAKILLARATEAILRSAMALRRRSRDAVL